MTGLREPHPFSAAPLETLIHALIDDRSMSNVARQVGADRHRIYRWRRHGLTEFEADRAAVAIGRHPAEIWPEWWQLSAAG